MKFSLIFFVMLLLGACFSEQDKPPSPATQKAQTYHEAGRRIYNFRCYYCHGYSGNARTLASTFVHPKPRDFTVTPLEALSRERMLKSIREGRPGTAMQAYQGILSARDMAAVADFIRQEFMTAKAENTRYHSAANGWRDFTAFAPAFPFATGKIALDTPWADLSPAQAEGKRLFLSTCVSCHDRARVLDEGPMWDPQSLSYPRNGYSNQEPMDAMASASVYAVHDRPPHFNDLTALERRGEALFQGNCAFCHGADGTGKNWIGSFLEPHPRNLTDPKNMAHMTPAHLRQVIREGLPGASMPAWQSVLQPEEIEAIIAYVGRAFHPLAADSRH